MCIMQSVSKYTFIRIVFAGLITGLILVAIVMELLPEEESKIFVVPTLVAALFVGIAQLTIIRKH
jgi:hypothetical protein